MNVKFDETRAADIITWLRTGTPVEVCAASAGVSKQTFYNWIKRGHDAAELERIPKSERPYVAFARSVEKAEADRIKASVTRLSIAAQEGDLATDKWFLERRCSQYFGQRSTVDVGLSNPSGRADEIAFARAKSSAQQYRLANLYGVVSSDSEQAGDFGALDSESASETHDVNNGFDGEKGKIKTVGTL